jgi:hypothetical protein
VASSPIDDLLWINANYGDLVAWVAPMHRQIGRGAIVILVGVDELQGCDDGAVDRYDPHHEIVVLVFGTYGDGKDLRRLVAMPMN